MIKKIALLTIMLCMLIIPATSSAQYYYKVDSFTGAKQAISIIEITDKSIRNKIDSVRLLRTSYKNMIDLTLEVRSPKYRGSFTTTSAFLKLNNNTDELYSIDCIKNSYSEYENYVYIIFCFPRPAIEQLSYAKTASIKLTHSTGDVVYNLDEITLNEWKKTILQD